MTRHLPEHYLNLTVEIQIKSKQMEEKLKEKIEIINDLEEKKSVDAKQRRRTNRE